MTYLLRNSLIALITAMQSPPAISQIAPSTITEQNAQIRIILTISNETDWDFEINENNTTIKILNGTIQRQTSQLQSGRSTFDFEPSGTNASPSNTIQLPCNCIISAKRYRDSFLIVDISNIVTRQNASITGTPHIASNDFHKWWQASSSASNHRNPLTATSPNDIINERSITKFAENENSQSRTIQSMETDEHTNLPLRIGISAPQKNPNLDRIINPNCPLKSLYQTIDRRPSALFSGELRSSREEAQNPNGSLNMNGLLNYSQELFSLGLTQEASQILSLTNEVKIEKEILIKVVRIASGEKEILFNENELMLCSGLLDLWILITSASAPYSNDGGGSAILQFKSLPPYLQLKISKIFLSSLNEPSNQAEILTFMATQSGDPSPQTLANINDAADVEHNLLLQANRDNPLKIIDLLLSPTASNPDQLMALSNSLRTQLRETDSWIDVMNAEITLDIEDGKFESAASKINLLISKEIPTGVVQSKIDQFIVAFLDQAPPREALSLQLSGLLDQWPGNIQDALVHHIYDLGFSDLRGDNHLTPLRRHIRQGHVVGPNEQHFSLSTPDNLQTDLTAQRVQQTLDQVKNFKQELFLTLQSE